MSFPCAQPKDEDWSPADIRAHACMQPPTHTSIHAAPTAAQTHSLTNRRVEWRRPTADIWSGLYGFPVLMLALATARAARDPCAQHVHAHAYTQAEASLSALIGKVNFSDTFSAATALQYGATVSTPATGHPIPPGYTQSDSEGSGQSFEQVEPVEQVALLFDVDKLRDAVSHANDMTRRYGVEILSINISKHAMQSSPPPTVLPSPHPDCPSLHPLTFHTTSQSAQSLKTPS